jgi:hypothetical protein
MAARTITVAGGDLFHLAAQYLGDATQAVRIAQQNGMTDYFFTDLRTLTLPIVDAADTGGVPPQ